MRRELAEDVDVPRCAWCGLPIRFQVCSVEEEKGGIRVYHEDCFRYGVALEPEKIGWTPIPRRSPDPSAE